MISNKERIDLKRLVGEFDSEDNTEYIRELKHSTKILADIESLEAAKRKGDRDCSDPELLFHTCCAAAPFLFSTYTDIFTRVLKDELDLNIMRKVLAILKLIEDKTVDQHEGSVLVGRLLKEMYLDSAVRRADKLDETHTMDSKPKEEGKVLSWKEYKNSL